MPCVIGPYRKVYTACLSGHNKLKAILSTKVSKLLSWGLQDRSEDHVRVNAHCLKMIIYLFIYLGIIHQEYITVVYNHKGTCEQRKSLPFFLRLRSLAIFSFGNLSWRGFWFGIELNRNKQVAFHALFELVSVYKIIYYL